MCEAREGSSRERRGAGIVLMAIVAMAAGCASNHTFAPDREIDVETLIQKLEAQDDDEEALFDLAWLPLTYLHLELFTETDDEEHYPEGHSYVSMRAWLPLLTFLDGEVAFYDEAQTPYETHEFTSLLWGLYARQQTTIQTIHGARSEGRHRLLWILDFDPGARYADASAD